MCNDADRSLIEFKKPLSNNTCTKITRKENIKAALAGSYCKYKIKEQLPVPLLQAFLETGNMASEKEMNGTVARIVRNVIFSKVPFSVDSEFTTDGRSF
jgi:hypothetical protein